MYFDVNAKNQRGSEVRLLLDLVRYRRTVFFADDGPHSSCEVAAIAGGQA